MTADRRRMNRSRILESAAEILEGGVYGDLTVDALARSLRMSKSTLYKYFTSKDDVVVSVVASVCEAADEALSKVDRKGGEVGAVLDRILSAFAYHASSTPRAVILQQARLPAASQDRISLTRAAFGRAFEEVLTAHAKALTPGVDPILAAIALVASAEAAMRAAARGEVSAERGDAVRQAYALLRPGLLKA